MWSILDHYEELKKKSHNELVGLFIDDFDDRDLLIRKHNEELEKNTDKIANEKAEKLFLAKKDEYQQEVLKQVQEDGIRNEGLKISTSSDLICSTFTVDGVELHPSDFIPDSVQNDPLYEDKVLIKNAYSLEWHEQDRKTCKLKFVCICNPTSVLVANPKGIGCCENIIVTLKGVRTPLIFPEGDISYELFRKQSRFLRKGLKADAKVLYEAFLRAIRECTNKRFITIPKHAGWCTLQSGVSIYISSESLIPGLEELFPKEVRKHKLIPHDIPLEDASSMYSKALPDSMESLLLTTIRTESYLLPFFEAERLYPDRGFVIVYNSESAKKNAIALTKRKSYSSTVIPALTDRITKVRSELEVSNDVTVLFAFSDVVESKRAFNNGIREILWELNKTNGKENDTRKLFVLLTNAAGSFPEEYPTYYISFDLENNSKNIEFIQHLGGMFDYALIQYIKRNPDAIKQVVREGIEFARSSVANIKNVEITDSMIMTLATAQILSRLNVVTKKDMNSIIHWFKSEASSESTISDTICHEFKLAVSSSILSGELKITKQFGPPYYADNGCTAFIREDDCSVNMNSETINSVIIPKMSVRSVIKMNKNLKEKGMLINKHTNKRKLNVAYEASKFDDVEVFSYSKSVLNEEAKTYVDDMIYNEYWFNIDEYPEGFVPMLYNMKGTRAAGYVLTSDMDENLHEVYFGTSRSGKTFALTNRAIEKVVVEGADGVIIFDQTGGFIPTEIDKHIGKNLRVKYCSFWSVYENGLPIDLLDLRGCLTYKDKKDRLFRIYAMMSKTLGSYEEQILKNVIKRMLKDMKNNNDLTIFDLSKYLYEDINEDETPAKDDAHRKLLYKIDSVLDDLRGTPQTKNNWGEFVKEQGTPLIIISTGLDGVGKGTEIIDMLLESLYSYKQRYSTSKYTVVLDEAQDLYLHEKGAVNTLLRKGGKHGITLLLASQSYPDQTTPFGKVVGNCGRVRGYRSKGDDINRYADRFGCDKNEANALLKGNCFDDGPFYSRYIGMNVTKTLKGKTVSFEPAPEFNDNTEEDDEQP